MPLLAVAMGAAARGGGVTSPTDDEVPPAGALRVLFIGNSLTYVNDLPGIVEALADSLSVERPFWYRTAVAPNYSLEDHWADPGTRAALQDRQWDVVVLQQGPSSLPENQELLREWSVRFAGLARAAGAVPALYMVWPDFTRRDFFDDVSDSYTAAAEAVDGMLFPVGRAWLAAWDADASLPLYGSDGFHPSTLATYLAALVILDRLYEVELEIVPGRVRSESGVFITVTESVRTVLVEAARDANRSFGR